MKLHIFRLGDKILIYNEEKLFSIISYFVLSFGVCKIYLTPLLYSAQYLLQQYENKSFIFSIRLCNHCSRKGILFQIIIFSIYTQKRKKVYWEKKNTLPIWGIDIKSILVRVKAKTKRDWNIDQNLFLFLCNGIKFEF